jgi:hypothetical protein
LNIAVSPGSVETIDARHQRESTVYRASWIRFLEAMFLSGGFSSCDHQWVIEIFAEGFTEDRHGDK